MLSNLYEDVIGVICNFLPPQQILHLRECCKQFHEYVDNASIGEAAKDIRECIVEIKDLQIIGKLDGNEGSEDEDSEDKVLWDVLKKTMAKLIARNNLDMLVLFCECVIPSQFLGSSCWKESL